jgi:hypothetical protein
MSSATLIWPLTRRKTSNRGRKNEGDASGCEDERKQLGEREDERDQQGNLRYRQDAPYEPRPEDDEPREKHENGAAYGRRS